jgi:hypothetical protein
VKKRISLPVTAYKLIIEGHLAFYSNRIKIMDEKVHRDACALRASAPCHRIQAGPVVQRLHTSKATTILFVRYARWHVTRLSLLICHL